MKKLNGHSTRSVQLVREKNYKHVKEALDSHARVVTRMQDTDYAGFERTELTADLDLLEQVAWVQTVFEIWGYPDFLRNSATTKANSYAFSAQLDDSKVNISELYLLAMEMLNELSQEDPELSRILQSNRNSSDIILGTTTEIQSHTYELGGLNPGVLEKIVGYIFSKGGGIPPRFQSGADTRSEGLCSLALRVRE